MNFVLKDLSNDEILKIKIFYRDYLKENKNEHMLFFAKTDLVAISAYKSGKIMFQGEDAEAEYDMWIKLFHHKAEKKQTIKKSIPSFKDYYYPAIGSDEVGTGDFFGPIVVCAFALTPKDVETFERLNIRDSKDLNDDKILEIGAKIKDIGTYSLLTLHNEKFNELTERGYNMNKIKAILHNKAILNVLSKASGEPEVILDQFTPEKNYFRYLNNEPTVYRNITFLTKAENKYACVALGSIMARYAFLKHWDVLSKQVGIELKKGASHLVDDQAAMLINKHGESYLRGIAKCNFKTLQKAKDIAENKQ